VNCELLNLFARDRRVLHLRATRHYRKSENIFAKAGTEAMANTSILPCVSLFNPPQCLHFGWCLPGANDTYRCLCHGGTAGFNCSIRILADSGNPAFLQLQLLSGALDLAVVVMCAAAVIEGEVNMRRGTTW
jgi:hypothetical protein